MRVLRFHTAQPLAPGQALLLDEPGSHHLLRVLRLKPGTAIVLFNGDGREYPAVFSEQCGKRARVMVRGVHSVDRESALPVFLGQGISRGERMDFVLQKSVELGVHGITPLWTRRSQVRLDGKRLEKRLSHWRGIVRSACEQSGRNIVPPLQTATRLQDWCAAAPPAELKIVLDPEADTHLGELDAPRGVCVLIGPEGGLEQDELKLAEDRGFRRITLGPRILRTETAALASLAALQALWGDLASA